MTRSNTGNNRGGGLYLKRSRATHTYQDIISVDNLLAAWKEFVRGKRAKEDVQEFQANLMHNILSLHADLKAQTYQHAGYHAFTISDPKPRDIHKASVRDRLLHHAIYRMLYPFFDTTFIHDSYSCRVGKGTHKALKRFNEFARIVSRNHTRTAWVLKCDIRKFFASISQPVLLEILQKHIPNPDILWLLQNVVKSFCSCCPQNSTNPDIHQQHTNVGNWCRRISSKGSPCYKVGLPLGNLTSQLLVNIYMNEFDQYVKHTLKVKHYIRYADDFVFLSDSKQYFETLLPYIKVKLGALQLQLHPGKVSIATVASGVDFLGWVHFADHRVLRTATKRRMLRRLEERKGSKGEEATKQSYVGMLGWGNGEKLKRMIN